MLRMSSDLKSTSYLDKMDFFMDYSNVSNRNESVSDTQSNLDSLQLAHCERNLLEDVLDNINNNSLYHKSDEQLNNYKDLTHLIETNIDIFETTDIPSQLGFVYALDSTINAIDSNDTQASNLQIKNLTSVIENAVKVDDQFDHALSAMPNHFIHLTRNIWGEISTYMFSRYSSRSNIMTCSSNSNSYFDYGTFIKDVRQGYEKCKEKAKSCGKAFGGGVVQKIDEISRSPQDLLMQVIFSKAYFVNDMCKLSSFCLKGAVNITYGLSSDLYSGKLLDYINMSKYRKALAAFENILTSNKNNMKQHERLFIEMSCIPYLKNEISILSERCNKSYFKKYADMADYAIQQLKQISPEAVCHIAGSVILDVIIFNRAHNGLNNLKSVLKSNVTFRRGVANAANIVKNLKVTQAASSRFAKGYTYVDGCLTKSKTLSNPYEKLKKRFTRPTLDWTNKKQDYEQLSHDIRPSNVDSKLWQDLVRENKKTTLTSITEGLSIVTARDNKFAIGNICRPMTIEQASKLWLDTTTRMQNLDKAIRDIAGKLPNNIDVMAFKNGFRPFLQGIIEYHIPNFHEHASINGAKEFLKDFHLTYQDSFKNVTGSVIEEALRDLRHNEINKLVDAASNKLRGQFNSHRFGCNAFDYISEQTTSNGKAIMSYFDVKAPLSNKYLPKNTLRPEFDVPKFVEDLNKSFAREVEKLVISLPGLNSTDAERLITGIRNKYLNTYKDLLSKVFFSCPREFESICRDNGFRYGRSNFRCLPNNGTTLLDFDIIIDYVKDCIDLGVNPLFQTRKGNSAVGIFNVLMQYNKNIDKGKQIEDIKIDKLIESPRSYNTSYANNLTPEFKKIMDEYVDRYYGSNENSNICDNNINTSDSENKQNMQYEYNIQDKHSDLEIDYQFIKLDEPGVIVLDGQVDNLISEDINKIDSDDKSNDSKKMIPQSLYYQPINYDLGVISGVKRPEIDHKFSVGYRTTQNNNIADDLRKYAQEDMIDNLIMTNPEYRTQYYNNVFELLAILAKSNSYDRENSRIHAKVTLASLKLGNSTFEKGFNKIADDLTRLYYNENNGELKESSLLDTQATKMIVDFAFNCAGNKDFYKKLLDICKTNKLYGLNDVLHANKKYQLKNFDLAKNRCLYTQPCRDKTLEYKLTNNVNYENLKQIVDLLDNHNFTLARLKISDIKCPYSVKVELDKLYRLEFFKCHNQNGIYFKFLKDPILNNMPDKLRQEIRASFENAEKFNAILNLRHCIATELAKLSNINDMYSNSIIANKIYGLISQKKLMQVLKTHIISNIDMNSTNLACYLIDLIFEDKEELCNQLLAIYELYTGCK